MDLQLKTQTIRTQLMLSFMLSTGLILTLVLASYLNIEYYNARKEMVKNLTVIARLFADSTAAPLHFGHPTDAQIALEALRVLPNVVSARVIDEDEDVFAEYLREGTAETEIGHDLEIGSFWGDGHLDVLEPIWVEGDQIGKIVLRSDTQALTKLLQDFFGVFIAFTIGGSIACYLGASYLRRRIVTPLTALIEGSRRMADGDLTSEVEVSRLGEIGSLASAFNGMMASLRGIVDQVSFNTASVSSVTQTLRQAGDALATEASRQDTAINDTAASIERINASIHDVNSNVETLSQTAMETSSAAMQMDHSVGEIAGHIDGLSEAIETSSSSIVEMTGAIREIARNADELDESTDSTIGALKLLSQTVKQVEGNAKESHQLSEQTTEQSELGRKSVQQTVEGMLEIQESFHGIQNVISELSLKSESIGEVVKVIEGVVEQTNLLALNAAIISSQAGEHGRAFAVVADEVRSLAERTAGSTREISELIATVQTGVGSAVEAMNIGSQRVEKGVSLSRQAGEILRVIGDSAEQSTQRIHEIVGAAQRQALDIDKVGAAMNQVKSIAAQLNRGTHEQDSASAEITQAVERMRELGLRVNRSTAEQRKESKLIAQSFEVVAARIAEIGESTSEQSKQGEQIREALQVFREVTHASTRRGVEMRESLEELAARSESLDREIGRFRV